MAGYPVRCLTTVAQNSQGHQAQGKTEKLPQPEEV